MKAQEMEKFVRDYVKALDSQKYADVEKFHAPDSVSASEGDPGKTMKSAQRKQYLEERWHAFPDSHINVKDIKADAEKGTVQYHWTSHGTHKGHFKGMAPTNKQVTHEGVTELQIKNNKITRETSKQDMSAFVKKLGSKP